MKLGLLIAGSVTLFVFTILTIVFTIVGRVQRANLADARRMLDPEGIRLETGLVGATVRYRDFRVPGRRYWGAAIIKTRRHLVLTDRQLAILGGRPVFFTPRGELHRWQVGLDGARLHLVCDDPPGATGHVDLRISVHDAAQWVTTLRDAGCRVLA